MRVIGISVTTKNQPFEKIQPALEHVAKKEYGAVLAHAFMPLDEILKQGFDPILRNTLDTLFPKQVTFYHNGPKRADLAEFLELNNATAYIIGNIIGGVKEEYEIYQTREIKTQRVPLV
ncbi:hypothetical protein COT72_01010 [archaeon CG10_big_fil_rev_8_21_14_0_10_43_11]|nr:MAG: hypothetical protein COT72_01010 [archaeon CG10_big_fil_rev_8_21_14_0_10_43_11]